MSVQPTQDSMITMPSVVSEISKKITDIKEQIKSEGVSSTVFSELSGYAKQLQDKLDELLLKKGLLTQSDINDAYTTLQEVQRREMAKMYQRGLNKTALYIGGFLIIILGVYLVTKRKKA